MIWPLIILSYISLFAVGLSDNIRGPLFPEILRDFQLTDGEGSWMFAISSFCGFLGSYCCRHFLKKWNHLWLLDFSLILLTLGLASLALAPNFMFLLVASCLTGFSIGTLGVTQNVLVTKGTSVKHRRQTLSGLHAMYGISSLLAPVTVGIVGYFFNSWRWSFAVAALITFGILIYSILNNPRIETRDLQTGTPDTVGLTKQPLQESSQFINKKRISWEQLYLGCALGTYVVAEIMVSSRLALFVRREQNADLEVSTLYVGGFFLLLLLGRLFFTWKHFSWPLKKQLQTSLVLSFLLILMGIYFHPFCLVLTGLTMAPFYPLAIAHISEVFPKRLDSAISYAMGAQSLLTVVMHTSVGYLTDWFGMTAALVVGPVFLLISFVILSSFQRIFRVEV